MKAIGLISTVHGVRSELRIAPCGKGLKCQSSESCTICKAIMNNLPNLSTFDKGFRTIFHWIIYIRQTLQELASWWQEKHPIFDDRFSSHVMVKSQGFMVSFASHQMPEIRLKTSLPAMWPALPPPALPRPALPRPALRPALPMQRER